MKCCFIFITFSIFAINISAQTLQSVSLKTNDSLKNVQYKYEYSEKDNFYRITIFLLRDGEYWYYENSCVMDLYSKGTWRLSKDALILNSEIQKNNVPVLLSLTDDTCDVVSNSKFGVVKNLKGDYLTDAFVNVNADNVKCLPMAGSCVGEYKTVDSVRLIFENGFRSKWVHVKDSNDSHILLKVNTNLKISAFISFENFKYKVTKKYLKPISNRD